MRPAQVSSLVILAQLCAFSLSASPPSLPNLLVSSTASNLTFSPNVTSPVSLNALPTNPYDYNVPQSYQTISFSSYGRQIPPFDVAICLLQAANAVTTQIDRFTPLGVDELQYSSGRVYLVLHPGSQMTWGMWGTAVRGITDFVRRYEFVDMDFAVIESRATGPVGGGILASL